MSDEPFDDSDGDDPEPLDDESFTKPEPLSSDERESVQADLDDLGSMQEVFATQGAKGVVIACADCGENHYYGWDLLKENLEHMLETGEPRMHEPAYEPREDEYVVWDYGKGYVDALADAGLDPHRRIELKICPWCEASLDPSFGFCPRCGRSLAPVRLYRDLIDRGIEDQEARMILLQAGFEPFA